MPDYCCWLKTLTVHYNLPLEYRKPDFKENYFNLTQARIIRMFRFFYNANEILN